MKKGLLSSKTPKNSPKPFSKQSGLKMGQKDQNRRVEYFIISSIIFHLILLFLFSFITLDLTQAKKEPLIIEFDENEKFEFNDFPQENETDEEVDTHRLSDKNRKVEDETVKKGSPLGGGAPKPPPKPAIVSPPVNPVPPKPPTETTSNEAKEEVVSPKELKNEPDVKEETPKETAEKPNPNKHNDRLVATDIFPDNNSIARLNQPPGTTSPGVKEEETVSLNTRDFKYYSYFHHIKSQIEMAWNYPLEAQKNKWGGLLSVIFTVEKNGRVSKVILISSSGREILDDSAINAINFASPFNPIPKSLAVNKLNITASFEYVNSIFGVR